METKAIDKIISAMYDRGFFICPDNDLVTDASAELSALKSRLDKLETVTNCARAWRVGSNLYKDNDLILAIDDFEKGGK